MPGSVAVDIQRNDHKVLVVSSTPVRFPWRPGESAERGLRDLRQRGRHIVLVHPEQRSAGLESELADRVQGDALTLATVEALLARERPGLLLPLPDDLAARRLVAELEERGILEAYGVSARGPSPGADPGPSDLSFRQGMLAAGLPVPPGGEAGTREGAEVVLRRLQWPVTVRPATSFGCLRGVSCDDLGTALAAVDAALRVSPAGTVELQERGGDSSFAIEIVTSESVPADPDAAWLCALTHVPHSADPAAVHVHALGHLPAEELVDWRRCLQSVLLDLGVRTGGSGLRFVLDPHQRRFGLLRLTDSEPVGRLVWETHLPSFWQRGWFRAFDGRLRDDPSIGFQRHLLQLRPGAHVLDIGTGGGIWALEIAEAVGPTGSVLATDIDEAMIARVEWEAFRRGLGNVRTRLVAHSMVGAASDSLDRILISDVYLFNSGNRAWGRRYLESCARALRDDGLLLIKNDKRMTTAWKPVAGPRREHDDLEAEEVMELGKPFLRLEALLPLSSFQPEPGQHQGYMLVLRKAGQVG